jgi:hypothetical protein
MNKLDVALKLLQLLNERKAIDSKVVAQELNVSLRTAQRYLVELSILPCVISKHNNHTYCLNPEYELSGALKTADMATDRSDPGAAKAFRRYTLSKTFCVFCGSERSRGDSLPKITTVAGHQGSCNVTKIDKLTALISKRLKSGKCSFP